MTFLINFHQKRMYKIGDYSIWREQNDSPDIMIRQIQALLWKYFSLFHCDIKSRYGSLINLLLISLYCIENMKPLRHRKIKFIELNVAGFFIYPSCMYILTASRYFTRLGTHFAGCYGYRIIPKFIIFLFSCCHFWQINYYL